MALRPPIDIETFQDLRKLSRWCSEQTVGDDESVGTDELEDGSVTLAKFQEMTADRILGRLSTNGVLQQLTGAQVVGLLEALAWAFSGNIGFHGEAASGQQNSPVTQAPSTVSGTGDDATINGNFTSMAAAINTIKIALDTKGLTG